MDPAELRRLQTRVKVTLFATQAMGSAGFLVASTVTPIVGEALSGHPSWAGVPTAVYWTGGALCAAGWGRLMDPWGRRRTLTAGLGVGVIGAMIASGSIVLGSFAGFVGGLLLMGAANSAVQLARFISGEVHSLAERGRAISAVVLGGTIGAVLGPSLVAPMSALATSKHLPGLAGPYAASAFFFSTGAMVVFSFLRPDPQHITKALAAADPPAAAGSRDSVQRTLKEIFKDARVRAAVATLALSQAVMVMLMVITSLHMKHHDHALSSISGVMSAHVLGMYAFSVFAGSLADRFGRGPLIAFGATLLVIAGLGAMPSVGVWPLTVSLFALGLGWNFCYVGGSTLLSDCLTPAERPSVQGINDSLLTAMAGLGSLVSGVVFSRAGYAAMGGFAAAVALIPLALGFRLSLPSTRAALDLTSAQSD